MDRHRAEPSGDRVHAGRSPGTHQIRRRVQSAVSRVERRLAGERPCLCRRPVGLRVEDEGDSDRRIRHLRRRDDRGVQESAHRGRVQRRADAGLGCRVGRRPREGPDPEQLCGRHRRDHHVGLVRDQDGRALLARVPAEGRRGRDQRADRDRGPAGRRPASRLRHRRIRHQRPAERRVHHRRQIPDAGLGPAGWRSPTRCSTGSRWTVPRAPCCSRGRASGCRTSRS